MGRSVLPLLGRQEELSESEWPQKVYESHTFHEIANYWPTRFVRTPRCKYHRNIAWQLDFPFASDLYASLTLEWIRRQASAEGSDGDVMVGARSLRQYIKRPVEELYDLDADPLEVQNLAEKPEYAGVLAEMRSDVELWQWKTRDRWLLRDGQSVVALEGYAHQDLKVPGSWGFVVDGTAYSRTNQRRVDEAVQQQGRR